MAPLAQFAKIDNNHNQVQSSALIIIGSISAPLITAARARARTLIEVCRIRLPVRAGQQLYEQMYD